ncbi:MAG: phosphate signaling complex protein PhoU [Sphingomonas sp.]
MNEYRVRAFDADLGELRGLIGQMGGLAERAIAGAIEALRRHDLASAQRIVADDRKIDALEKQVEELAVRIIAQRAPVEIDLREVVAAMKIANVVERIGDYAKNIAKRVPMIEAHREIEPLSVLPAMARLVAEMVHDVLDAFAARDAEAAAEVCERDRGVDDYYNSLFRVLVTHMMENPKTISQVAHLLFVAKHLERVGDHATNVAEMVYYAATGVHMAERGRGAAT